MTELSRGYQSEIEALDRECPVAIIVIDGQTNPGWVMNLTRKKATVVIDKPNGELESIKNGSRKKITVLTSDNKPMTVRIFKEKKEELENYNEKFGSY